MSRVPDVNGWPFYIFLCFVVLLVLRLLRVADTRASSTPADRAQTTGKPVGGWLEGRKLDKLASTTALSRAHTELFHSKIDELQAQHDLERLAADLQPPVDTPAAHQPQPPITNTAALSLAEIRDLLAVVDIDEHARADLLRLAAARLAEKRS